MSAGGLTKQDETSADVQAHAEFAAQELAGMSNSIHPLKLERVISAHSQVRSVSRRRPYCWCVC